MQSNVLVFSIAQNGYDFIYSKCIKSQQLYASKNSYEYVLVNRPRWVNSPEESAWLKIPLILVGLCRGYEWVLFVDADAEIRPQAPKVESLEVSRKSLYLVHGHSGRVNSGVIIAKNTADTKAFFQQVLSAVETDVPEEDKAPYENGHVIHFSRKCEYVYILDQCWNNTVDLTLNDFIRHYTGPMRQHYRKPIFSQLKVRALKTQMMIRTQLAKMTGLYSEPHESIKHSLESLTQFCQDEFSAFNSY